MSNANQLTQWLDPTKVSVVTLEELMVHLRNNFGLPLNFGFSTNAGGVTISSNPFQAQIVGPPGRAAVLEGSKDLQTWAPLQTNTLSSNGWQISLPLGANQNAFFRALLEP
jgi:hypothetical protein